MYPVVLHLTRQERSSRLLVVFRPLMLLPHLVWAVVYDLIVSVVLLLSGASILLTGRHPETLWDLVEGYFRYTVKVNAYALMLSDTYPPFVGGDDRPYPVRVHSDYPARMSRIVLIFRPLLIVPHALLLPVFSLYILCILHLTALVALFTGRIPRWLWRHLSAFLLYVSRVSAYMLLLVDEYPPFNTAQPLAVDELFSYD